MNELETQAIAQSLKRFGTGSLAGNARSLFETLGYQSIKAPAWM